MRSMTDEGLMFIIIHEIVRASNAHQTANTRTSSAASGGTFSFKEKEVIDFAW
jgi:hypothetical protein